MSKSSLESFSLQKLRKKIKTLMYKDFEEFLIKMKVQHYYNVDHHVYHLHITINWEQNNEITMTQAH